MIDIIHEKMDSWRIAFWFVMAFTGITFIGQAVQNFPYFDAPQTFAGWIAVIIAVILGVVSFLDKRKIAKADASNKIIREKDQFIEFLQTQMNEWREQAKDFQNDLNSHREMHHNFRNDVDAKLLRLSAENSALSIFLSERGHDINQILSNLPPPNNQ